MSPLAGSPIPKKKPTTCSFNRNLTNNNEETMTTTASADIETAVLSQLRPGQEYPDGNINARSHYTEDEIEELGASLKGHDGQLRPFLVATHPKKPGVFFVFGGGRRRLAYERLVGRGDLPKTHPIEIKNFGHITREAALSKSLADNQSVLMHPADQAATFAKLATDRAPEDIARERGMTLRAVKQSIALGTDLAPEVLASWRAGKIKREAVEILVLADNKTQKESLEDIERNAGNAFGHTLRDLRARIMRNKEAVMTRLLGFIGVADVRANGIAVTEDFFGGGGVVKDLGKLEKIAGQKMAALEKAEKANGWSWADGKITQFRHMHHGMGEQKVKPDFTPAEKKRAGEIDARLKVLDADDFPSPDEERERGRLEIEREDLTITALERAFTDKQRAAGGVLIRLRDDGSVHYQRGLVRKAEKKTSKKDAPKSAPQVREPEPITRAARDHLEACHDKAMASLLEKRPRDAAVIYVASIFYDGNDEVIEFDYWDMSGKSRDLVGLIAKFRKMKDGALLAALLPAVTKNLRITDDGVLHKGGEALVKMVGEKEYQAAVAKHFKPKEYFTCASKKHLLGVMAEAFGAAARKNAEDKSEAQLVAIFVGEIGRTGWLPTELRTKAYAGPSAKKAGR